MREKRKSNSAYRLFFLSYIAILLLTISSLFVYYAAISRQVASETRETKLALLNRLREEVESKLEYTDLLYNEFVADNKLTLLAKGYSSYSYGELLLDLERTYHPDYLSNFTIYIAGSGEIATRGLHMRASTFFANLYRPREISWEDFSGAYLKSYHLKTVMPPIDVSAYGRAPEKVMPYIRSFPPNSSEPTIGQFLFFIKTKDIESLIAELSRSTRSGVYIFDDRNRLMLCSEGAAQPTEAFVSRLGEDGGIFDAPMGRDTWMAAQRVSPLNQWRYVIATAKGVYLLENEKFIMYLAVVFLAYLIAGLAAVRFLSGRSYRPVKEIKDIIDGIHAGGKALKSGGSKRGREGSEFREIKRTILDQMEKSSMLSKIIEGQMPIVRRDYLLSLVKGLEVDYEQAPQKLEALGIPLMRECFLILALEFDLDSPFFMEGRQLAEEKLSAARVIVQDIGRELIPSSYPHYFMNLDMNRSIFLINSESEALTGDSFRALLECMGQISGYLSEKFAVHIYMGAGSARRGIRNLPKCLDEAQKALDRGRKRQTYEAVCFEDENDLRSDFYFPAGLEYQLVSDLKNARFRESRELLNHIFEMNSLTAGQAASETPHALLYELASAFARAANGISAEGISAARKTPLFTCEAILEELGGKILLSEAKLYFMQFVDRIAELTGKHRTGKTEQLVNSIASYIESNAGEKWLDLNELSKEFSVTPQYISNIFKKYRQESVKDYISKVKLNHAKELLSKTDLSIQEISIRLGYVDELGIFRLFRKYENMTPGEYRNLGNATE